MSVRILLVLALLPQFVEQPDLRQSLLSSRRRVNESLDDWKGWLLFSARFA